MSGFAPDEFDWCFLPVIQINSAGPRPLLESVFGLRLTLSVSADQHAIRFIPRENGLHSIDVRFNGSHIPGSPFKIRVGEVGQDGDPGLVSAFGSGLERGTTGIIQPILSALSKP